MNRGTREGQGNRTSTVLGRRLGGELQKLRAKAGKTQLQAAHELSATTTKVTKMESGWVPMRDPDIRVLCQFYGATDADVVNGLLDLARLDRDRRKAKGWWQQMPIVGGLGEYIAMEEVATRIRTWQPALVPGLLQTPEYIRALGVTSNWSHPDEIEALVTTRTKRQGRLWGDQPLEFHAVLWEAVLRQQVGGPDVMRAQLNHLVEMAQLPHVHVQVLPFRAGPYPGANGAFNIVSFSEPGALEVGYAEAIGSTLWAEGVEANAAYTRAFAQVSQRSLAPHDSVNLIDAISKGM
ncbi:helix-turn-helix transcriptional regulator [Streptomyces sp. NBC_00091]|uniref:helix-turn-helix domain-containing protein n=1 Tax=Streptomyces sp. NBC_00091 TaxID=2975648 RepID=UPI0022529DC3|nr:helix-turn-helix transcriptional regulator [Streptomyces sp. NBC_00091]MCX5377290.1 helix-turn-helix domain-containing protein [Streptomyces sp. NBC_00091]